MGVLTDFVIVERGDAQRVCDAVCPSREFGGLDAKGIDTVKMGTLHAILNNCQFDPTFMNSPLACAADDGPWVFEVPPDFVQQLAILDEQQLISVGAKWAATEEFSPKHSNWPQDAVQEALTEIAALCKRAITERKSVLMWMCL